MYSRIQKGKPVKMSAAPLTTTRYEACIVSTQACVSRTHCVSKSGLTDVWIDTACKLLNELMKPRSQDGMLAQSGPLMPHMTWCTLHMSLTLCCLYEPAASAQLLLQHSSVFLSYTLIAKLTA